MSTPMWAALTISLAMLPGVGFAPVKADEPIKTTLCDLLREPERFNGKIVSVNGRILIAFEDFELRDSGCDGKKIDGVWFSSIRNTFAVSAAAANTC